MVLVKNWPFSHLFLKIISGKKMSFTIFWNKKKRFLGYKNTKLKKSNKLRFFQRGWSMVLVKNWLFFHLFFKDNIGQENVFYDILERKNPF